MSEHTRAESAADAELIREALDRLSERVGATVEDDKAKYAAWAALDRLVAERDEARQEHLAAHRDFLRENELRRAAAARVAALEDALRGPLREALVEAGSILHSNSDHPERIDFAAALAEIDKAIAVAREVLAGAVSSD